MDGSSVNGNTTRKWNFLVANGEVARVDDLGRDVNAVLELEGDQVRLAVLDFIESGLFLRGALDVGERVVVVDDGNQEWLTRRLGVERVVELECGCVAGAKAVELLCQMGFGRVDLIRRLGAERFKFFLVGLGLARAYVSTQCGVRADIGTFFWFHEDFEIGLDIRFVADFGQQKRINVASRGDEVQIAADSGLGRVNVAEVVRAVYDPELFVAGREIEDLFVLRQNNERRKAELGANGDNIFLRILHDARGSFRRGVRGRSMESGHANNNDGEDAKENAVPLDVKRMFHR